MKLIPSFDAFLDDEVNLNKTRVDQANTAFAVLTDFIKAQDDLKDIFVSSSKQGSLRQGTIIKPRVDETEFDVDMLIELAEVTGWSATDYLDAVHHVFKNSERYKDIVDRRGKHRCVRIDYASNDFHVDVVPSIEKDGDRWIMNRDTNQFEQTDGDGYAAWFASRSEIIGQKHLIHSVRLSKYLRDEHKWPVKSILLTTLLGLRVDEADSEATFPDLPTTLLVLTDRLDLWLQSQTTVPTVCNPALPSEEFVRHWDEDSFEEFREGFNETAAIIRNAYSEPDRERSLELWQAAFGESFVLAETDKEDTVSASVALAIPPLGDTSHAQPISVIAQKGSTLRCKVNVSAALHDNSGRKRFRGLASDSIVPRERSLKFRAWTNAKAPYSVHWQVVNTGPAARAAKDGLRGGFMTGRRLDGTAAPNLANWEATAYPGRHWIECFIVKDGVCVARSGKFFVRVRT